MLTQQEVDVVEPPLDDGASSKKPSPSPQAATTPATTPVPGSNARKANAPQVQLIGNLPVARQDALSTFNEIPVNNYQNKSIGKSKEMFESMTCDCVYEHGVSDPDDACGPYSDCINRLTQVECLEDDCRCRNHCQNQRFQKRQYANIEIVLTELKGYGLRAEEDIPKDTFIYEYVGDVVSPPAFKKQGNGGAWPSSAICLQAVTSALFPHWPRLRFGLFPNRLRLNSLPDFVLLCRLCFYSISSVIPPYRLLLLDSIPSLVLPCGLCVLDSQPSFAIPSGSWLLHSAPPSPFAVGSALWMPFHTSSFSLDSAFPLSCFAEPSFVSPFRDSSPRSNSSRAKLSPLRRRGGSRMIRLPAPPFDLPVEETVVGNGTVPTTPGGAGCHLSC
ncbi:hypothetical protein NMY22_g6272 [Coprinellus aureogranulatus]|nr:hypothetical protein NMY22_g6272 [Coprinellus aureogranulatus]